MRKCRNWQTSKTKDLVIIAIVWVQVPSSALNNKTGTKQSVWSLSCCSKPKRALNPWFKVSPPARSARGMRSPGPHSPHLAQDYGRGRAGPMGPRSPLRFGRCRTDVPRASCGLRFTSVVAEQTSPGRLAVSAPLRSAQSRHPPDVLRSPLRFGRCRADIPRMSCNPSSTRLWSLRGRLSIMIRQER